MKTAELEHQFSLTEKFEAQAWTKAGTGAALLAEAKNHEAENVDYGNFTLVRNGMCVKCDTCGSTRARVISVRSDVGALASAKFVCDLGIVPPGSFRNPLFELVSELLVGLVSRVGICAECEGCGSTTGCS